MTELTQYMYALTRRMEPIVRAKDGMTSFRTLIAHLLARFAEDIVGESFNFRAPTGEMGRPCSGRAHDMSVDWMCCPWRICASHDSKHQPCVDLVRGPYPHPPVKDGKIGTRGLIIRSTR